MCCGVQRFWEMYQGPRSMCGGARAELLDFLAKVLESEVICFWWEKFAWHCYGLTVDSFTWAGGVIVFGGGSEA